MKDFGPKRLRRILFDYTTASMLKKTRCQCIICWHSGSNLQIRHCELLAKYLQDVGQVTCMSMETGHFSSFHQHPVAKVPLPVEGLNAQELAV